MTQPALPKIAAIDLDGTLVNEARLLTPLTHQVLQDLHTFGLRIGLASGRPCSQLYKNVNDWNLGFPMDFIIGMNGAELYDEATHLTKTYDHLSEENLKEIVIEMRKFNGNGIIYEEGTNGAMQRMDELSKGSENRNKITYNLVSEEYLYSTHRAKIMYRFVPERMKEVLKHFQVFTADKSYTCFLTQPTVMEFASRSTNKVNALRHYCERYGFSMNEVFAAGDTSNDCRMLEECGMSLCMCNGTPDAIASAKAVSDYDNDHDGFAHYIYKHWLNKEMNNETGCD